MGKDWERSLEWKGGRAFVSKKKVREETLKWDLKIQQITIFSHKKYKSKGI